MGRDRGSEKQWVRDLSEETAGARGERGRREDVRGRDIGAKQEGDGESSTTVCQLSWIVLPHQINKKGVEKSRPSPLPRLILLSSDINPI